MKKKSLMDHMKECKVDGEKYTYEHICNEMLVFILAVSKNIN